MIKFHIITIFPRIFSSYFNEGILKNAQKKKLIEIKIYNLRDFTKDKRKTVDLKPFGGGPGMVLGVKSIYKAVEHIKKSCQLNLKKSKVVLLSAKGKEFNQEKANKFSKVHDLIFICGRYEGVDERVAKYVADEEVSVGDYILSGGELGVMMIIESVSRLIPGVLGNIESIEEKRFSKFVNQKIKRRKPKICQKSYPVYTRPEIFEPQKGIRWRVPKVLLSGNHKKIDEWREKKIG